MSLSFKIVQLFKDYTLGSSTQSRGRVCRAKCDGLHCAAKILSDISFSPASKYKVSFKKDCQTHAFRKLEEEIEFLCTIRHPNLAQYFGIHQDHASGFPVILMELLDSNLTDFLQTSKQSISYHVKASVCHDIIKALSFLHSYGIVHKYLTGNNVLLHVKSDIRAKIGDFGTSKIIELGCQLLSANPHMNVYTSPESLKGTAEYSEQSDCFSFGVLVVQILTLQVPSPTEDSTAETEVKRRQNHIKMVDLIHPLLPIALSCLRDEACDRPSAQELCDQIESVKDNDYEENTSAACASGLELDSMSGSTEEVLQSLREQHSLALAQKDKVIASMQEQVQNFKQQLEDIKKAHLNEIAQKNWMITEREIQLSSVNEKLIKSEQTRANLEEHSLSFKSWAEQPLTTTVNESKKKITLEWGKELSSTLCCDFSRFCCNAVVDREIVYFKLALSPKVYAFDAIDRNWSQVPTCPYINGYCSIVVVNGLLTTVGDYDYGDHYSNRLFSLTSLNQQCWRRIFPSMPTRRCLTTALCVGTALIVAGGREEGRVTSKAVEVMNTETYQWLTAADLPEPLFCSSAVVCGDRVYILGGKDRYGQSTTAVYSCSVTALLKSCKSRFCKAHHPLLLERPLPPSHDKPSVWSRVADLPVVGSTCVSLNGQVVAVGGRELNHSATTAVHVFNPSANSWVPLDQRMSTPRTECFAAVLPGNHLMITGGYIAASSLANTVEIAAVS